MKTCLAHANECRGDNEQEEDDGEIREALGDPPLVVDVFSGGGERFEQVVVVTYHDAVVPGEYGYFVDLGDEVPAGGRVAGNEDSQRNKREGVPHGPFTCNQPSSCQAEPMEWGTEERSEFGGFRFGTSVSCPESGCWGAFYC